MNAIAITVFNNDELKNDLSKAASYIQDMANLVNLTTISTHEGR